MVPVEKMSANGTVDVGSLMVFDGAGFQLHSLTMFNLLHVSTIYLWAGKVPKKHACSQV